MYVKALAKCMNIAVQAFQILFLKEILRAYSIGFQNLLNSEEDISDSSTTRNQKNNNSEKNRATNEG